MRPWSPNPTAGPSSPSPPTPSWCEPPTRVLYVMTLLAASPIARDWTEQGAQPGERLPPGEEPNSLLAAVSRDFILLLAPRSYPPHTPTRPTLLPAPLSCPLHTPVGSDTSVANGGARFQLCARAALFLTAFVFEKTNLFLLTVLMTDRAHAKLWALG